jgi:hypothetical protein
MGLLVQVYRNNQGDSTNGGVSSKLDQFTVANVEGPWSPFPEDTDVLFLDYCSYSKSPKLIPAVYNKFRKEWEPVSRALGEWVQFGGNYAGTSDSRFSRATSEITGGVSLGVVKIFDRIE